MRLFFGPFAFSALLKTFIQGKLEERLIPIPANDVYLAARKNKSCIAMGTGERQAITDLELANYIAGFVDGEGSFHVAIQRNPSTKTTWQLVPEFHVSQHMASRSVLDLIRDTLGCGYVKPNHRQNPSDDTYVYVVRSRADLISKVIPFFREFRLRTSKREDFEIFSEIVLGMQRGDHRSRERLIGLLKLAFSMNRSGRYRRASLDEIVSDLAFSDSSLQTAP